MLKVAWSILVEAALIRRVLKGNALEGEEWAKPIRPTVSDAVIRSWLWPTATRSSPLYCKSVDYCK